MGDDARIAVGGPGRDADAVLVRERPRRGRLGILHGHQQQRCCLDERRGQQGDARAGRQLLGTARITLGAHDGPGAPGDWRGRSVEQTLLLSVGLGTVTGTVWQDLDGDGSRDAGDAGREAVEVFLDLNGNGVLDRPATPTATTPWFPVDHLAGGSHVGDAVSGQIAFDASGRLYVSDGQTDRVHRWDPVLGQFVQFTANGTNQEARGPRALAFGIDGDLYVASSFDTNVRRFNGTTGAFVEELWPDGAVLVSDRGIMAASPDRRILYIADFNPAAGAPYPDRALRLM